TTAFVPPLAPRHRPPTPAVPAHVRSCGPRGHWWHEVRGCLEFRNSHRDFHACVELCLICSPWSAPYAWRRRRSTLRSPTWVLLAWPLITLAMYSGSAPTPPSSIL